MTKSVYELVRNVDGAISYTFSFDHFAGICSSKTKVRDKLQNSFPPCQNW
jgi:hypothetical protein